MKAKSLSLASRSSGDSTEERLGWPKRIARKPADYYSRGDGDPNNPAEGERKENRAAGFTSHSGNSVTRSLKDRLQVARCRLRGVEIEGADHGARASAA